MATPTSDVPVSFTPAPTLIETFGPTDPAPTETPLANDQFTSTPTPTLEQPTATVEPTLESLPTSTP